MNDWQRTKSLAIRLAIFGILLELAGIFLITTKRLTSSQGTPILVIGMLLAFVPIFVIARKNRRR